MKSITVNAMVGTLTKNPETHEVTLSQCPCCGNLDLYAGHHSCDAMSVSCMPMLGGCGLKIAVSVEEVWEEAKYDMVKAEKLALDLAAERWNRRS